MSMDALVAKWRNLWRRDAEAIVARIAQPRFATVANLDPANHAVRLTLQPSGIQSGWVPDASGMASPGGFGVVNPLPQGTQVLVAYANGDSGQPIIIGRLYSSADMPPVSAVTGKAVQPGEYGVFTDGAMLHITGGVINAQSMAVVLKAASSITLDTPSVTTTGNLSVGTGATGTFTSLDGQTVTVQDGIIINIC